MESFLENVKSLSWWISVVLVGIVLSWIAAYLKAGTDRLGSTVSRDWRGYTAARAAARAAYIQHLQAHPHEQVMLRLEVLDDKVSGIADMAVGSLIAIAFKEDSAWLIGLGAVIFLSGAFTWRRAYDKLSLLREPVLSSGGDYDGPLAVHRDCAPLSPHPHYVSPGGVRVGPLGEFNKYADGLAASEWCPGLVREQGRL